MKKSLFLALCFMSSHLFAGECTYQNDSSIDLSSPLTATLEELGCVEASELERAANHLRIELLTYNDLEKQLVVARATVVNLRNGHVVNKDIKQTIIRRFAVAWKTYGPADYEFAGTKAVSKLQHELAQDLSSGWIIE